MLTRLGKLMRRWRRRFSRARLLGRWLGYSVDHEESHQRGLIILQIDGLSRQQFEAALEKKRLPFLKKMIDRRYFEKMSFYSGVPSTTPAVQGEIMYGVKCAVPAFQFVHRRSGQVFRMFEHEAARTIVEERLSDQTPLLTDGASFSNIYSGGAEEARFCAETTTLPNVLKNLNPLRILVIFVLYFFTLLRILWLAVVEFLVATGDMLRGLFSRQDWQNELKFVPKRVLVSIVMREWIRIAVKVTVAKGTPVIYANFLGYDEQAHRRGPSAAFAHWGLKGIDRVVQDIFKSAKRSDARDYELIVLSDHGQEETKVYDFETGRTIQEAVEQSLRTGPLSKRIVQYVDNAERGKYFGQGIRRPMRTAAVSRTEFAEHVIVTAMGPIGHIYFPVEVTDEVKADFAKHLVEQEQVPLAIYRTQDRRIHARNRRGFWSLEKDSQEICGEEHPFAQEVHEDLLDLCDNADAGDVIICGWAPDERPLSFVQEHGAHGGIGSQETRGFALIPREVSISRRKTEVGEAYVRGIDLYAAGLSYLDRRQDSKPAEPNADKTHLIGQTTRGDSTSIGREAEPAGSSVETTRLRVITYNTHHCVGLDGKCRPRRIAAILSDLDADLIALQEVDANRFRSGHQDQVKVIASCLGMHYHYFPVWSDRDEGYGLAVLSRFPITVVREGCLTDSCERTKREARGAIWVSIEPDEGGPIHFLTTHLGLRESERIKQVDEILSERWLSSLRPSEPVIVAGDFNAAPRSKVLKRLAEKYRSVHELTDNPRSLRTFASMMPLRGIDHVWMSPHFRMKEVFVPKDYFTAVASDHLPLLAELELLPAEAKANEHHAGERAMSEQSAERLLAPSDRPA